MSNYDPDLVRLVTAAKKVSDAIGETMEAASDGGDVDGCLDGLALAAQELSEALGPYDGD